MFIKMYFKKEDCIVNVDPNYYVYGARNNELVPVTFIRISLDRTAKLVPWTFAKVKPTDLYFLEYTYYDHTVKIQKRCHVLPGESNANLIKVIDEYGWCGYVYNNNIKYDPDPIIKSCKMAMNSVYGVVTKIAENCDGLDIAKYSLAEWNRNNEKIMKERIDECNRYFRDHDIPMQITNIKQNDKNRDRLDAAIYSLAEWNRIKNYILNDEKVTKELSDKMNNSKFEIKEVKFNGPATIVFWKDGTKTVVKCGPHDKIDYEKGLAMAITKRALGDTGHYYETIKKYAGEEMTKDENRVRDDIWMAYQALVSAMEDKKATKAELWWAMEEAIRYLGSRLDE